MKKMLFIAPSFFGYYKEIIKELEKESFEVDYLCDAPSNSNISKALGRIDKRLIKKDTNKYYKEKVIPRINEKEYNYVFVIVGMTFSFFPEMIKEIRKRNSKAKFIMYQWDGEENLPFVKEIQPFFDDVYTFDRVDALTNEKYKFLPLFYSNYYKDVGEKNIEKFEYDVSYIGTAHPQKIYKVNEMSKIFSKKLKKQFIYHYMPSKLKYYYHKLTSKEYRNVKLNDLKMEKLPLEKTMEVFEKSKCIFDAPQKGQKGLTIRTIECLGAKRKLITINEDIKNYDFYNEKNIYIYNGKLDENSIFFTSEFEELPQEIYEKYSLKNWLKTMIKD